MEILKISFLFYCCFLFSCKDSNINNKNIFKKEHLPKLISDVNQTASGPYFTKDENERPVLVWTEELQEGGEKGHVIKYSFISEDTEKIYEVLPSRGCRAHDESMNKIAFKSDGTVLAVFSKRTPTKENRFAGSLFYTQSFDKGKSWKAAQYLHVGDTTAGLSRSFFDIAQLPDGEIGAIWLDSRLTKKRGDGSSLFFAKTKGKMGFVEDQVIGTKTCECCRTDLFVSSKGAIHVAFRDILQDSIRDMSHLVSTDNGLSFSSPKRISPDNWMINGCPHSGPALGETSEDLYCVWFSMGGGQGLYYASSKDKGHSFNERKLLTEYGKHPQLLALENDKIVFVWEELDDKHRVVGSHHDHNSQQKNTEPVSNEKTTSYIKAQILNKGFPVSEQWISLPNEYAEYPVITAFEENKLGIAWIQEMNENQFGIYFRSLDI